MEQLTVMDTHYLTSLFTPQKVALFGASDRENSVGGVVFRNLLSAGFEGKIFAPDCTEGRSIAALYITRDYLQQETE